MKHFGLMGEVKTVYESFELALRLFSQATMLRHRFVIRWCVHTSIVSYRSTPGIKVVRRVIGEYICNIFSGLYRRYCTSPLVVCCMYRVWVCGEWSCDTLLWSFITEEVYVTKRHGHNHSTPWSPSLPFSFSSAMKNYLNHFELNYSSTLTDGVTYQSNEVYDASDLPFGWVYE